MRTGGVHITAAANPAQRLDVSGYIKFFLEHALPTEQIRGVYLKNTRNQGIAFGLSSALTFDHAITAALSMQYSSPKIGVQTRSYSGLLYFLTIDKAVQTNLKLGVSLAPLFVGQYTYRGMETKVADFAFASEGNIQLPKLPLFFKASYQFGMGKNHVWVERNTEIIDNRVKTGL